MGFFIALYLIFEICFTNGIMEMEEQPWPSNVQIFAWCITTIAWTAFFWFVVYDILIKNGM